ncbi:hypothetical protein M426DRAFT_322530 [Hypoxylon sp. CI-4A]|nr:hypothetical protein M426DRAFT_322530 [Hypoxylon sp. CI-4A]
MNHPQQPLGGRIVDLQSAPSNRSLTVKYRRNGKLQSCEPCRRSKLRCDHVVPTCGRCVRRGCVDQCVYHPNPLAQNRRKGGLTPPASLSSPSGDSAAALVQSIETSEPEPRGPGVPLTSLPRSADVVTREVHRAASAPPLHLRDDYSGLTGNRGFLGETSYISIFADGLGTNGPELDSSHVRKVRLSHDRIAQGCKVLSFLKENHMLIRLASRWYEICEDESCICVEPIMKEWLWGIWTHHGDVLRDQNPEKIRRLCELVWRNTQTPLVCNENTTAIQWARAATGPGLRWEVIGLIATVAGQCAGTPEPTNRSSKTSNLTNPAFPRQMSEIAEDCLSFSRECEAVGDMFTWLLMENYCLTAKIKGETGYVTYTQAGEIVTAAVALGLHQGGKQADRLPFFLAEIRKRLFAQTYSAEIAIATFLGRPPRISYRYCTFQSPLDLPVSQLVLQGDDLALAIASLDEKGFNTAERVNRVTWMKTWLGFAPQREDILDLALAQYTPEEVLGRAEDIQRRNREHMESLPQFIKKIRDGPLETEGKTPTEILFMVVIRQAFSTNELLLQRVLIRKAGASSEKLVHIAREILQDILFMSQRHDLGSLFQTDIASLLGVQGMRSAAVIAVELLKQEQLPVYPKDPLLPRSQTIQDLAIFAARLGAIDPADGSYSICDQGRKVITHILDKILTPPTASDRPQTSHELPVHQDQPQLQRHASIDVPANDPSCYGWNFPGVMDSSMTDLNFGMEASFLGPDNDFMQWLENVDWERSGQ